ncbi:MAG: orotate phosphoribosyltransferase [Chloroflexota bacterium]|nr:orotate phosphoribosyltransferase [Chloroflexota bacterium]
MVAETGLLDQLRTVGALKDGHFLLSSGRHSDRYIEKFDLLRNPGATESVCRLIADQYRDAAIDVVVGPTTGGVILAFEVGRQLGVMAAFAERAGDGATGREFRRGTTFAAGQRVLVVDDILTTGGSVRETLAALEPHLVEVVAVAVLVDRSSGGLEFDVPLRALASMEIMTWTAETCPYCARGKTVVKPGTTVSAAR